MRVVTILRAMIDAIMAPKLTVRVCGIRTLSTLSTAVLLTVAVTTTFAYLEASHPGLHSEGEMMTQLLAPDNGEALPAIADRQGLQLTSVLGFGIMQTLIGIVLLSLLIKGLAHFLTNSTATFGCVLSIVSVTLSITILTTIMNGSLHLLTGSLRWGIHMGIFVSPAEQPLLFGALQRIGLDMIWRCFAAAIGVTSYSGLHHRFGFVVGTIACVVVLTFFGILAAFGAILAAPN